MKLTRGLTLAEVLVSSSLLLGLSLLLVMIHRSSLSVERSTDERSEFRRAFALASSYLKRDVSAARVLVPAPSSESDTLIYILPSPDSEEPVNPQGQVLRPLEIRIRQVNGSLMRETDEAPRELCQLGSKGALRFNRVGNRLLEVEIQAGSSTTPVQRLRMTWFLRNQP